MTYRGFFPAVLVGLTTVLVIVLSFSFVISLVLSFTSFTEQSVSWLILTAAFIAMFLGGVMSGAKAKERGLMAGASTALLFSLITFLIQFLGYDSSFTSEQYMYHGGYLLVAALGGIIGVNLSSNK
ncbi:TIGR04086 family membrane protein [Halalkalibacter nanhaiisediminis]|uniref:Putative membrane protein (TIGR04086 family) n=1 Tax=Halalkalibacter nanhaiisediminis TaxID=688079 RepID=A0A562QHP5_9BACI|nr:TIGR04086 family membrane protein [Halalkalibacter nanhaiisediminis]TWI56264.1 putative membrane protein (TIGR04086 family) [Halalkalibacter nanhaiisediminis]